MQQNSEPFNLGFGATQSSLYQVVTDLKAKLEESERQRMAEREKTLKAESETMLAEEKMEQLKAKMSELKEKMDSVEEQVSERDSVILEMKKRLDCEQTDQVIYESRLKQMTHDLDLFKKSSTSLTKSNQEIEIELEQLKQQKRETGLKIDLLKNQIQSLERQVGSKVVEIKQ